MGECWLFVFLACLSSLPTAATADWQVVKMPLCVDQNFWRRSSEKGFALKPQQNPGFGAWQQAAERTREVAIKIERASSPPMPTNGIPFKYCVSTDSSLTLASPAAHCHCKSKESQFYHIVIHHSASTLFSFVFLSSCLLIRITIITQVAHYCERGFFKLFFLIIIINKSPISTRILLCYLNFSCI